MTAPSQVSIDLGDFLVDLSLSRLDIFTGQLKSTLECSMCHYQSITFDMFWDLSIPLPRVRRPFFLIR